MHLSLWTSDMYFQWSAGQLHLIDTWDFSGPKPNSWPSQVFSFPLAPSKVFPTLVNGISILLVTQTSHPRIILVSSLIHLTAKSTKSCWLYLQSLSSVCLTSSHFSYYLLPGLPAFLFTNSTVYFPYSNHSESWKNISLIMAEDQAMAPHFLS